MSTAAERRHEERHCNCGKFTEPGRWHTAGCTVWMSWPELGDHSKCCAGADSDTEPAPATTAGGPHA